ncbi:FtsX-like permease family protein [uncultured Robinsoniella sp.]|uniref:ABC transporter permease n=1 Tax=uncultured Robinsoniella sp. TaxID=904190 RepID=UPI00374FA00A
MIRVENKKVIAGLAKKNYRQNWKKNILIIAAIILTTFMITAVCSIGVSYWNAISLRHVMMNGMKFDVSLPAPTIEQVKKAYSMDEILYAGINVDSAVIDEYKNNDINIPLSWSDTTNWEKQCVPAYEFLEGKYPDKENEVMLSTQTLKRMGIDTPEVGMHLPVSFFFLSENETAHEKTFVLSGYYRDYSGISQGFISQDFYEKSGADQTVMTQGSLRITLKNQLYSVKDIKMLEDKLSIKGRQMLFADYYLMEDFAKFVAGLLGLFILIVLSGYLFICNVLHISIAKEVRFFGQLKTIGTTSKQIRGFVHKQVLWNSLAGIPLGMVLGAFVSFLIVPSALEIANPTFQLKKAIVFHPFIFIGAALFSGLTIYFSSRKPAMIAGDIAPVEAAKYYGIVSPHRDKISVNGGRLSYMAWRNMFRVKKQAVIILSSFFVTLTTLLVITTLVNGSSAKHVLNTLQDFDMRILNNSVLNNEPVQRIQPSEIGEIKSMDGVAEVRTVSSAKIIMPYEEDILKEYFKRLEKMPIARGDYEEQMELYKEGKETDLFTGRLVGIDEEEFDSINKIMGGSLNKDAFMSGEIGLISPFLMESSIKEAVGKELVYQLKQNNERKQHKIKIGGEIPNVNFFSNGYLPSIVISDGLAKEILGEPVTEILNIVYEKPFNAELDKKIKALFKNDKHLTIESKFDNFDEMKESETQLKILGGGLGIILTLLAILNYCNMTAAGIQNRIKEFAALQSIGMTTVQIRKVLLIEGAWYGIVSFFFVIVLGIPIDYIIYHAMNRYRIPFQIPVGSTLLVFAGILAACIFVPYVVYQFLHKDNIVEQLRDME